MDSKVVQNEMFLTYTIVIALYKIDLFNFKHRQLSIYSNVQLLHD